MSERHDISLYPASTPNPPDLLRDILQAVEAFISPATDGAINWVKGKGDAEIAKAAEIKAKVVAAFAAIDNERQRLILERDRDQMAHREKMFALKTERLKSMIERINTLEQHGAQIDIKIKRVLLKLAEDSLE
jgi:hypothetical protein